MVSGFLTGLINSLFSFTVDVIGLHPVACAPNILVLCFSINPQYSNSSIDFQTFVIKEPPAIGTTILSGALKPSCSRISNVRDFEPSA